MNAMDDLFKIRRKIHGRNLCAAGGINQQIYSLAIRLKELSFIVNSLFIKMESSLPNRGGF